MIEQITRDVLCLRDDANIKEMDLTIGLYQIKKIAQQYTNSKLEEIEKWCDEKQFVANNPFQMCLVVRLEALKDKIDSLKQKSQLFTLKTKKNETINMGATKKSC